MIRVKTTDGAAGSVGLWYDRGDNVAVLSVGETEYRLDATDMAVVLGLFRGMSETAPWDSGPLGYHGPVMRHVMEGGHGWNPGYVISDKAFIGCAEAMALAIGMEGILRRMATSN